MTSENELKRALAALLLHATGNNGPRDGNPYSYGAVIGAVLALFPGRQWSDVDTDEVRALAQEPGADEKLGKENATVLSLIVKGNRFAAAQEAARRRIPAVFARELTESNETVLHVSTDFERDVIEWFTGDVNAAPYPAGSLLHYGYTAADRARRYRGRIGD